MSRKEAREAAFKLIYERTITGEDNPLTYQLLSEEFFGDDADFIKLIFDGVVANYDFLNDLIEKYSRDFKLERVYKVDLSALLLSAFEILFCKDIPFQISVNEAVNLSKKYSTEKSYRFVNGILSSLIRDKAEILGGIGVEN